jgi:transcriptional/translational regulatory protein YebC/TACO1
MFGEHCSRHALPAKLQIMVAASEEQARRVADSVVALLIEAGLEDINVNDYRVLTISGAFTVFNHLDMLGLQKNLMYFMSWRFKTLQR